MPEFPDTPDDLFLDPFVDRPLIYRLNDSGFELRSVGANGTEDVGGLMELETDRLRPATGGPSASRTTSSGNGLLRESVNEKCPAATSLVGLETTGTSPVAVWSHLPFD